MKHWKQAAEMDKCCSTCNSTSDKIIYEKKFRCNCPLRKVFRERRFSCVCMFANLHTAYNMFHRPEV